MKDAEKDVNALKKAAAGTENKSLLAKKEKAKADTAAAFQAFLPQFEQFQAPNPQTLKPSNTKPWSIMLGQRCEGDGRGDRGDPCPQG